MKTNNKLREALKEARVAIEAAKKKMGVDNPVILEIIDAALAAPPRNCDRFASAEEAWDAYDKWVESYRTKGEIPPYNEFGWLYALATERKGESEVGK